LGFVGAACGGCCAGRKRLAAAIVPTPVAIFRKFLRETPIEKVTS
jgi:hypothetical protein